MTSNGGVRKIVLTQGKFAIVDSEDFEFLNQFKWYFNSGGYANRHTKMINGKRKGKIMMHRIINDTPAGFHTDHINGDRLDNRKLNLRTCNSTQNIWNSKVKGISYHKRDKKWQVRVQNNKKRIQLGYFDSYKKAKMARNKFILETRGKYARL